MLFRKFDHRGHYKLNFIVIDNWAIFEYRYNWHRPTEAIQPRNVDHVRVYTYNKRNKFPFCSISTFFVRRDIARSSQLRRERKKKTLANSLKRVYTGRHIVKLRLITLTSRRGNFFLVLSINLIRACLKMLGKIDTLVTINFAKETFPLNRFHRHLGAIYQVISQLASFYLDPPFIFSFVNRYRRITIGTQSKPLIFDDRFRDIHFVPQRTLSASFPPPGFSSLFIAISSKRATIYARLIPAENRLAIVV